MKKYGIIFIGTVVTAALLFNIFAFKGAEKKSDYGNGYILLEVYEIPSYSDAGVHIHYGNLKTEIVPFKSFKDKGNHDDNADIILKSINKFVEEGYKIESTCAGLSQGGMITKIFMRK
ncbi:MAG: hypothetical protein EAZ07_01075 [Cytophagales bacterium]|nr:MAG: hypothetical protein EAZ07_01075 [Cytophagales bacterium]